MIKVTLYMKNIFGGPPSQYVDHYEVDTKEEAEKLFNKDFDEFVGQSNRARIETIKYEKV